MNSITLQGRLTKDPDLRYTKSEKPVLTFTLAVDRDFVNSDGERETDFIQCVAWNKTAEFITKYFTKGQMMLVQGRYQIRDYVDRNNDKRKAHEVYVSDVWFCGPKKQDGPAPEVRPQFEEIDSDIDDGDLPF